MTATSATTDAAARLEQKIGEIQVPEPKSDTEALLLKIGLALPIIGLVLVLVAWYRASDTPYVANQIPMLISGGLFGLGLAVIGLGLFIRFSLARLLRFWMARFVLEQQAQTDRVVDALERGEAALRDRN